MRDVPEAVDDPTVVVKQAKEFAAHNAMRARYIDYNLLGAAHYRAGQYKDATKCFEQSIAEFPSDPPPSHGPVLWPQLFLAMNKWQQGEHDDARRLLREIEPAINKSLENPKRSWAYRQITEVLRREAEAMIGQEPADEAKQKDNPTDKPSK